MEKGGLGRILRELDTWIKNREEGVRIIVGRDFNAKTGKEGAEIEWEEKSGERSQEGRRGSRDGDINFEGRMLLACFGERGWSLFNGCVNGDE